MKKSQQLLEAGSRDLGKMIANKRAIEVTTNTVIEGIQFGKVAWYRFGSGKVAYSITEDLCVFIDKNGEESESLRDLKSIFE